MTPATLTAPMRPGSAAASPERASDLPDRFTLPEAVVRRLRPPAKLTVSEWCDRHRHLESRLGSEPGRWSTSRTPYLREIMDSFIDPAVGSIILIKCARVGGTELLNNLLAYSVAARPMPTLYVMPRESDINEEFARRIRGVFTASPTLRAHIPSTSWATADALNLDSMDIYGAWASAPSTMIRRTAGIVLFDEIDNCQKHAGRLGNTWELAAQRLATYGYRAKQVGVTTPTTEDAPGWVLYMQSDQRRHHVPCPHCGAYQVLIWDSLKWPAHTSADAIESGRLATYVCAHCGCAIEQSQQRWMIARGVWVPACQRVTARLDLDCPEQVEAARSPHASERWTPPLEGDPPRTRARGYWLNVLYSPWRGWSLAAATFLRVKGDPEKLVVFRNQWLAETWKQTEDEATEKELGAKLVAATHEAATVPAPARLLLAGADVQQDRIYYTVRAFGPQRHSWLVEAGTAASLDELYALLFERGYPLAHEPGTHMVPHALAVDCRYREDEVYRLARKPGVVAVMGHAYRVRWVERVRVDKRIDGQPVWRWNLSTDALKNELAGRIHLPIDGDGAWHLHVNTPAEYLQQISSEHRVLLRDKSGRKKWSWVPKTSGRANHWWDCEVYVTALISILRQTGELDTDALSGMTPRLHTTPTPAITPAQAGPTPAAAPAAPAAAPPQTQITATTPTTAARPARRVTGGWQR